MSTFSDAIRDAEARLQVKLPQSYISFIEPYINFASLANEDEEYECANPSDYEGIWLPPTHLEASDSFDLANYSVLENEPEEDWKKIIVIRPNLMDGYMALDYRHGEEPMVVFFDSETDELDENEVFPSFQAFLDYLLQNPKIATLFTTQDEELSERFRYDQ